MLSVGIAQQFSKLIQSNTDDRSCLHKSQLRLLATAPKIIPTLLSMHWKLVETSKRV